MWKSGQCVGYKPLSVDSASSKDNVIVRKDLVHTVNEDGNDVWDYQYKIVSKDDWFAFSEIIDNSDSLAVVTDAIVELAEIIGG